MDLVRKLATACDETAGADPQGWYRKRFDKDPNYSDLLDSLARTPAERQQLLRGYFEPATDDGDGQEGQPTAAHHSIASLIASKHVRVIITTNFDRLLETALAAQGITPTVLSSPETIRGALPLIHTECCVLKLHGDYLDPRIRNTEEELNSYPEEYYAILDRILDEFGLVVCGWSAEWDGALRSAIQRTPSRRFTTFWAAHGPVTDAGQALIAHRGATVIAIDGADKFFSEVREQVQAIDQFSRPHPYSIEVAMARIKRYLSESRFRIRLADLVQETVERVIEELADDALSVQDRDVSPASLNARIKRYDSICSTLIAMACVGARWAEDDHFDMWQRAIQSLAARRTIQGGMELWIELQLYPEAMLLYALGLGAIEGRRLALLNNLLCTPIRDRDGRESVAVLSLPAIKIVSRSHDFLKNLDGMERRRFPMSDWMHTALRPSVGRTIRDPESYTLTFDTLEILVALAYAHRADSTIREWVPVGAFAYRHDNCNRVLGEIEGSLAEDAERSRFVTSRVFGRTVEQCQASIAMLRQRLSGIPQW